MMAIGANATGKSNVRDALRFLHGIARGYTLADTIGEKWGEGGVLRGGTVEAARPCCSRRWASRPNEWEFKD